MTGLTWLHLSDWHQSEMDVDRKIVLDALLDDIKNRATIDPNLGHIDFIVFSGDVAFNGKSDEYKMVKDKLFDPILKECNIKSERLFIVPGNHDLDRTKFELLPQSLAKPLESNSEANNWLSDDEKRREALKLFRNFTSFVSSYTHQENSDYANIRSWNIDGKRIALMGINSAWMCARRKNSNGDVDDKGVVIVGEPQIYDPLRDISEFDIKIAVMHHPLDWLADFESSQIKRHLIKRCHFILRGHQHEPYVEIIRSTYGDCIVIPAGACYNHRSYANAYNFVHLDFETGKGVIFLRCWNGRDKWREDIDSCKEGKFHFISPLATDPFHISLAENLSLAKKCADKKIEQPMQIETLDQRWNVLRKISSPPLIPDVFLANREDACDKVKEVFSGKTPKLRLDTYYPNQVADFISAYTETLDKDTKSDIIGRCLIIPSAESWCYITGLSDPHILVADFDLDNDIGAKFLDRALRGRHSVIFPGLSGAIPGPNRAPLPNPRSNQIKDALEKANYNKERARTLAQKSNGNLGSLLRLLQNISIIPEWAQGTGARELSIAEIIGSWSDNSEADKAVVESLARKPYGEWLKAIQEIAQRQNNPLNHRDNTWEVAVRYEGWYALGPKLLDSDLDCYKAAAIKVLRETDPKFELPSEKRIMANVYGKVLNYSYLLRKGIAESLALLGSYPDALKYCSPGRGEATAVMAVREILYNADWILWASLDYLLPLLAEAAPGEFLNAVEGALDSDPYPFDILFAQEKPGVFGQSYMAGLLWALETLAWDPDYLIRVVVLLGELASKDPGGNWSNRPANSLSTILLPWLPQTCATVSKRKAAVEVLNKERPQVAWTLLLSLLPESHGISRGSRKPEWRKIIPDDWPEGITNQEYWEQITAYVEIATNIAKQDLLKLVDLIDRLDDLWPEARNQILAYLGSDAIVSMPEADRVKIWTRLVNLVSEHRKFAEAKWAMKPDEVNGIAIVAEKLVPANPIYRYQRLFIERDFDLFEEKGDWREQQKILDEQRQRAVHEVFKERGIEEVIAFAKMVESPWRVGFAFGVIAPVEAEFSVLPTLLESVDKSIMQFAGGFTWGRFRSRQLQWIDEIDTTNWTPSQLGQFLAFLPFASDTWKRVTQLLPEDESPYWSKASVNPYGDDQDIEMAIDRLVKYGRALDAIICFERIQYKKRKLNSQQAIRVLQALLHSQQGFNDINYHAVIGVVKELQNDPSTNIDELSKIEWAFLPLLDGLHGASPRLLENRLADDPIFFCDVIRTAFPSKKEDATVEEPTEQQKLNGANAYRLFHNWKTPPGSQRDGTYSGDNLIAWLENAKKICRESGHLDIALTMIGQVLFNAPPDPNGFWINCSVANALNAKDAQKMRNGFQTAVIASRGVYNCTGGEDERNLAQKYRMRAEETDARKFHRLAETFRDISAFYEQEAEREASRDKYD